MAQTLLDQPLGDLRREISDLRQVNVLHDYNMHKLARMISVSRDTLRETGNYQQQLLEQLHQFEISLADINQILRANHEQKAHWEQQKQQTENDLQIRAKLMALNAEALECRAAAVQLQQDAQIALAKAAELEKRANDELAQQALEMKEKQQEMERNRLLELERRKTMEEERERAAKELQWQKEKQKKQIERSQVPSKNSIEHVDEPDQYANWISHDFMQDEQHPQCIVRLAPQMSSVPVDITYLDVHETEHLLDEQEELIGTPLQVKFHSTSFILIAIPYVVKRSAHRENVIKIRQPNGLWISIDTQEPTFDAYKEKRFVQCQLHHSTACAVVSRLKRDAIFISRKSAGRFASSADPRLTLQWPKNVSENDFNLHLRIQPIEFSIFNQFCQHYSHECQGLIGVGPIIDLATEEISLLQPIQLTSPILAQPKKKTSAPKVATGDSSVPPSQQELIAQQQQSIFRSMLGEDSSSERLILLYCHPTENTWHADLSISLNDSKTHDIITADLKSFHGRMIIARCDKQIMSVKKLQTTISLLEQTLNQRSVSFLLRHRLNDPHQIFLVCCPSQKIDAIDQELQQENYPSDEEQSKEVILQEGQLLELRFRGNVLPKDHQSRPFAFNTYFPFYFETMVIEIDKYSQHFSPCYYGFVQIFTKQKVLKTISKDLDKKKALIEPAKQEWVETDVCLAELIVRLPKVSDDSRSIVSKTLATFPSEGILTPTLFRDISASLTGEEWRWLGRRLGITRIRLEAIDHDHGDDAPYYTLLAWFKRVPRSADKPLILIQALININRWDLAQDLQHMIDDQRQEQRTAARDDDLTFFRVPFNRICQREECLRIWKQIARALTLSNSDIEEIEQQYSSRQERCLRSLEAWAKKQPRADIPTLARVMRSLGFKSLAREIDNMA